jgi:hypothetical protein
MHNASQVQTSEKKHILFPTRPMLHRKPMTDDQIKSCLEEVGQVGFTFSFAFNS